MLRFKLTISIMLLSLIVGVGPAFAALISTGSHPLHGNLTRATEGLSNFTGTLEYFYDDTDSTKGQLTVELTNTTPSPATQAFLTAFALNNPEDKISGISFSFTAADANIKFYLLGTSPFNNNEVNVAPFGNADFGAGVDDKGKSWEGGGKPQAGIPIGESATFVFDLTGTSLNTLTTQSFIDELTEGPGIGGGPVFFVSRFRGIDPGDGSDKVPATVPLPPSVLLLGSGLFGLGLLGWRRKREALPEFNHGKE